MVYFHNDSIFQTLRMCVLIVTGSMRKPPQNCSIQGLELLSEILSHSQYDELKRKLDIEAEPFPSQLVYVSMVAARVLTILISFRLRIVSQSQDSRGNFITWTLVTPYPMIRRNYVKNKVTSVDQVNNNVGSSEAMIKNEVTNIEDQSQILLRKDYV